MSDVTVREVEVNGDVVEIELASGELRYVAEEPVTMPLPDAIAKAELEARQAFSVMRRFNSSVVIAPAVRTPEPVEA